LAAMLSAVGWFGGADPSDSARNAGVLAMLMRIALFVWDGTELRRCLINSDASNYRSALLIWRQHRGLVWACVTLFAVSTVFGIVALSTGGGAAALLATLSFLATFASLVVERYVFFVAALAPRMPGGVAE
jgi:DMSO reductase anchor subunit